MRLHPRHRIDANAADMAYAAWAFVGARRRRDLADSVERTWSPTGGAVACLSARSAFDLLLSAFALPAGSEVLVSAVTVPAMAEIVRDHGLVPVPVDIDPGTLAPRLDALGRLVTHRTRAVLVAQLFGGRHDLAPVVEVCRQHGLLLIEDCAQSFRGLGDTGAAGADASLFSSAPSRPPPPLAADWRESGILRCSHACVNCRMGGPHKPVVRTRDACSAAVRSSLCSIPSSMDRQRRSHGGSVSRWKQSSPRRPGRAPQGRTLAGNRPRRCWRS